MFTCASIMELLCGRGDTGLHNGRGTAADACEGGHALELEGLQVSVLATIMLDFHHAGPVCGP